MALTRYITKNSTAVLLTIIGSNPWEDIRFAFDRVFSHPRVTPKTILVVNSFNAILPNPDQHIKIVEHIIDHKACIAPYFVRLTIPELINSPVVELLEIAGFIVASFMPHQLGEAYEYVLEASMSVLGFPPDHIQRFTEKALDPRHHLN